MKNLIIPNWMNIAIEIFDYVKSNKKITEEDLKNVEKELIRKTIINTNNKIDEQDILEIENLGFESSTKKLSKMQDRFLWAKHYLIKKFNILDHDKSQITINKNWIGKEFSIDNLKKLVSNYNKEYLKQKKSINQEKGNKEILNNNPENIKDEIEDYLVQSSLDKYIKFLKDQLYIKLMSIDPYVFEEFIKDFFNKLGYENVEKTKSSSDGGVDLLIYRDKFNFDPIIVQIKRYSKDNKISINQLREFSTVIEQQKSRYGLFLTTSDFSPKENKRNDLITQNKQIKYWNFDNIFSLMYKNKIAFKVKWPDSFIEVLELDTQYFDKYIIETE